MCSEAAPDMVQHRYRSLSSFGSFWLLGNEGIRDSEDMTGYNLDTMFCVGEVLPYRLTDERAPAPYIVNGLVVVTHKTSGGAVYAGAIVDREQLRPMPNEGLTFAQLLQDAEKWAIPVGSSLSIGCVLGALIGRLDLEVLIQQMKRYGVGEVTKNIEVAVRGSYDI